MNSSGIALFEKNGQWYFQGDVLRLGGRILIDGIPWVVLGVGRSRSVSQAPFIWIRNEHYGTTVYAPGLAQHKPRLKTYPKDEIFDPCMTAA